MKKINILLTTCLSSFLLLSCSTIIPSNNSTQNLTIVSTTTDTNNPDSTKNDYSNEIKPLSNVKLSYLIKSKKLFAKIKTTWNNAQEGSLYVRWQAPKNTSCYSASFPIKKYKDINDYTTAYKIPFYNDKKCKGLWKIIILDKNNNSILSKDSYIL